MLKNTFKAIKLSSKGQSSLKQLFFLPLGLSIFSFLLGTTFFSRSGKLSLVYSFVSVYSCNLIW